MHIVVAAHDLYPDPGSGGTGRYVFETARRLVERGHRVSVVTRRRGGSPPRGTVAGVDVVRYDLTVAGRSGPDILGQLPGAYRTVRDHITTLSRSDPPDLVSFQGLVTPLLVDRAVPDAVPRVTTFHSPWPTEYALRDDGISHRSSLRRLINVAVRWGAERSTLARSDGVIALSRYMLGQLRRVYGSNRDAAVIPAGVDPGRFSPDAAEDERLSGAGPAFLTVRRLVQRMGHDRLLDAFADVLQGCPEARLYIAGDGPLRGRLERRAAGLDIADRTTFLGYVSDRALPSVYAAADVFVLPTQQLEGFGLATLEALASGTPVVATPVGGTVEVLAGLRGRLPVDPVVGSPRADAIAEGLRGWVSLDRAVRERAGAACRRYACAHYGWEQTVSALLEEYDRYG